MYVEERKKNLHALVTLKQQFWGNRCQTKCLPQNEQIGETCNKISNFMVIIKITLIEKVDNHSYNF